MIKIFALNGFLGLSSDWDGVKKGCAYPFEAVDLFSVCSPVRGLKEFGKALNAQVAKQGECKRILLGYSLGGRLAMHALLDDPTLWDGAVIVSAHTGLQEGERPKRQERDDRWAERFKSDPWQKVVEEWERQEVFQGKRFFAREEKDYDRLCLAQAMSEWSVSKQEDLQNALCQLPLPILWVAGEMDERYVGIAEEMAKGHGLSSCWIAPGVGHRVPWECSKEFVDRINDWLQELPKTNF